MKRNCEIRKKIADANIYLYQLSEQIGIAESTIYRWLHHPLDGEHQKILMDAVEKLQLRENEA